MRELQLFDIASPLEADWIDTWSPTECMEGEFDTVTPQDLPNGESDTGTTVNQIFERFESSPCQFRIKDTATKGSWMDEQVVPVEGRPPIELFGSNDGDSPPQHSVCGFPYREMRTHQASSKEFAKSNLKRHRRKSRKRNCKAGLICPIPGCGMEFPMRSENLRPHLQNVQRIPALSIVPGRQAMIPSLASVGLSSAWHFSGLALGMDRARTSSVPSPTQTADDGIQE